MAVETKDELLVANQEAERKDKALKAVIRQHSDNMSSSKRARVVAETERHDIWQPPLPWCHTKIKKEDFFKLITNLKKKVKKALCVAEETKDELSGGRMQEQGFDGSNETTCW